MYFSISNGKRFFQRIDKIHIKSINDTNKYQSNCLANFNRIIIIPFRQKTLFHFTPPVYNSRSTESFSILTLK